MTALEANIALGLYVLHEPTGAYRRVNAACVRPEGTTLQLSQVVKTPAGNVYHVDAAECRRAYLPLA